jgi:mannose-6-phosphate isomerase-like protein (cupin superfamily)
MLALFKTRTREGESRFAAAVCATTAATKYSVAHRSTQPTKQLPRLRFRFSGT